MVEDFEKPLPCNRTMDIIILLDGRAGLKKEGWDHEIVAAKNLITAFEVGVPHEKAEISVITYAGPRTWSGIEKCTGESTGETSSEGCGTKMVSHFTSDLKKLKTLLTEQEFPKGGFLTSLGLMKAKAELPLGRPDAHSIVVVFSAGPPLSFKKTREGARALRKSARLLWVPVSKFAPLKNYKDMATRRWQENIVKVEESEELSELETIDHIIADICPSENPTVEMAMPELTLLQKKKSA